MAVLLQQVFEQAAARYPEQAAVRGSRGERWSYAELGRRSRAVAARLEAAGCVVGARVGVWMRKSPEAVGAVIGILQAGGIYVPLDAQAPSARIAALAADCGLWGLIADEALAAEAAAWPQPPGWLATAGELATPEELATAGELDRVRAARPARTGDDVAYVLYTSGSTGVPKGVMLTHAHALNFVQWAAEEIGLSPGDRVASHAPFHFDLSIFDLWATLSRGAEVCLLDAMSARFPQAAAEWILQEQVTVWYSVPSALVAMQPQAARVGASGSVRAVIFAGEVFPAPALRGWRQALPGASFHNWYGPTETNVCTWYRLPAGAAPEPLPIGRACPNFELALLDGEERPVAAGETGFLWVRGPGILAGYWGDEARTAQVTRLRPAAAGPPQRWYNTGDLARWGEDGELYFQGRRDAVVKCRGYRISLLEVERALEAHPAVAQAGVVPLPDAAHATRLAAWVRGSGGLEAAELRAWLRERLPVYMVPEQIEIAASLPVTSTGKLDRQRLGECVGVMHGQDVAGR